MCDGKWAQGDDGVRRANFEGVAVEVQPIPKARGGGWSYRVGANLVAADGRRFFSVQYGGGADTLAEAKAAAAERAVTWEARRAAAALVLEVVW